MTDPAKTTQQFLDSSQYQQAAILQYESIYGEDFVSPGGRDFAQELIATLALDADARVLDVGCGLGGSAFLMAREFGWRVEGIDLSRNMLALAQVRLDAHGLAESVQLRWGDCLELDEQERYAAVYSRDVFLHIADKPRLFTVLYQALRPGGRLLFTDYCCGAKPWSDAFEGYVDERGYHLHTPQDYGQLISAAGFQQVVADDITQRFIDILELELARIDQLQLDETMARKLAESWRDKIARARAGEQRWGLFSALKPG